MDSSTPYLVDYPVENGYFFFLSAISISLPSEFIFIFWLTRTKTPLMLLNQPSTAELKFRHA